MNTTFIYRVGMKYIIRDAGIPCSRSDTEADHNTHGGEDTE